MQSVAIVGFATAGLAAAECLRRDGFTGDLTIIGEETHLPYDRPPLSKDLMSGKRRLSEIELRPTKDFDALGARILRGVKATSLDATGRVLTLDTGEELAADGIVLATGVHARQLPMAAGVHGAFSVRSIDDAWRLQAELGAHDGSANVVVIGGGALGCEMAATVHAMGHSVDVVEAAPLPVVRQFGSWIGARVADLLGRNGVRLWTEVGVTGLQTDSANHVTGVELGNGTVLDADVVVVSIGSVPATAWLEGSGLSLTNGIDCDHTCLAAPGIVAAGDVASWIDSKGARVRSEAKLAAISMGNAAARRLMGATDPYEPIPFFWTNQFDVLIQAYGSVVDSDEMVIVNETDGGETVSAVFGRDGRVVGALGWKQASTLRGLRRWVDEGRPWVDALREFQADTLPVG